MTQKQRIEELEKELKSLKERVDLIERVADLCPIKPMGPADSNPFFGTLDQQNNPYLKVN